VINATSASLGGQLPPLPKGIFAADSLAYDMMYGQGQTPFLVFAGSQGVARLADGLGMLVEQAAEAFRIWRGIRPDTAASNGHAARRRGRHFGDAMSVTRWLKRLLLACIALLLLYQFWLFGWVLWWNWFNPDSTRFMSLRLAELQLKDPQAQLKKQWVGYDRISANLKRAIIAAEDAKFVDHEGFDWEGIQHAIEKNQRKGRIVAGGSTISQQLAKNLFLTPAKTTWRKAEEAIVTLMLETIWSKQRIFEVYLNVIEWGNGVFGAEAAARHYYGVTAAQLTPEQAARLAGMVPSPRFYDRNRNAPGLARKTTIILARMRSADLP
jgi:monofunctional biosynthetic peptidoglycan transglycosylase